MPHRDSRSVRRIGGIDWNGGRMLHQKRDTKNTPRRQVGGNDAFGARSETQNPANGAKPRDFEGPLGNNGEDRTGWLEWQDSNLRISESEFANALSPGGGIRTSAYGNQLNGGVGRQLVASVK
jgi:hypothetical protein